MNAGTGIALGIGFLAIALVAYFVYSTMHAPGSTAAASTGGGTQNTTGQVSTTVTQGFKLADDLLNAYESSS